MSTKNTSILLYGGTYTGEMLNGIPDGLGLWMHPDGQACVGEWVYDNRSRWNVRNLNSRTFRGHVALKLSEGEAYVGSCMCDQFCSETDGPAEKTPFLKSFVFHGEGTLTKANGTQFIGEWRLGKLWNGARRNKDGVITEKYSLGQALSKQQLSPALKKKSRHLGVFLIVPALFGWLVIGLILLLLLISVGSGY